MPRYCITMERCLRIAKWFEAPDDDSAREEARMIYLQTNDEGFEGGDSEYDYAVVSDEGKYIVYWD